MSSIQKEQQEAHPEDYEDDNEAVTTTSTPITIDDVEPVLLVEQETQEESLQTSVHKFLLGLLDNNEKEQFGPQPNKNEEKKEDDGCSGGGSSKDISNNMEPQEACLPLDASSVMENTTEVSNGQDDDDNNFEEPKHVVSSNDIVPSPERQLRDAVAQLSMSLCIESDSALPKPRTEKLEKSVKKESINEKGKEETDKSSRQEKVATIKLQNGATREFDVFGADWVCIVHLNCNNNYCSCMRK